jgi:hypothetical protein
MEVAGTRFTKTAREQYRHIERRAENVMRVYRYTIALRSSTDAKEREDDIVDEIHCKGLNILNHIET